MLLCAGANPSASDENGLAPLHFLFKSNLKLEISANVQLLLDAAAHMGQVDANGRTTLDSCKFRMNVMERPNPDEKYLDSLVKDVLPFSLSSFCAQVISRIKIPFKDALPPNLRTFVKQHGGKM